LSADLNNKRKLISKDIEVVIIEKSQQLQDENEKLFLSEDNTAMRMLRENE